MQHAPDFGQMGYIRHVRSIGPLGVLGNICRKQIVNLYKMSVKVLLYSNTKLKFNMLIP